MISQSHVHSAKGAFGMNTGIMDAHNLAWKLALLCKGIAKPGLLDTYDLERHTLRKARGSRGVSVEPFTGGAVGW